MLKMSNRLAEDVGPINATTEPFGDIEFASRLRWIFICLYLGPYRSVGCWKDRGRRAISTLEGKDRRLNGPYTRRAHAIQKCYQAAKARGYRYFAVQNGGWCASSSTAGRTYRRYGRSNRCRRGKGGPWANDVYIINGRLPGIRAWSSSVYSNNRRNWGPQLAMRGRSRSSVGFFHSKLENRPWLRIQIPVTKISGVGIINRKNCCGNRLRNLQIRAGMSPSLRNRVVGFFKGPGRTGAEHTVTFRHPVVAKYITFQLMGRGYLQINGIKLYRGVARPSAIRGMIVFASRSILIIEIC